VTEEQTPTEVSPEEERADAETKDESFESPELDGREPAEEPVAGEEEDEAVDELTALSQELEETRAREAEYLDGWQRARAELSNARKRFEREQKQAYTNAKTGVLTAFLPIVDDFERALDTVPEPLVDEPWLDGIRLILHKHQRFLEQAGVEPIETAGQEFDPFFHEAVTHEPSDDVPQGHVISELQRGYKAGDRVLRPSMVRVSSGPLEEPPAEDETADGEA
jgi:molecular chaperone GrpE